VANASSVIDDGVAVEFDDDAEFFSLANLTGTVLSGETEAITATFRSLSMAPGDYVANIETVHDDSGVTSPINTTATITVADSPGTVTFDYPSESLTLLEGDNLDVYAYGTDPDGVDRVEFYWGASKLGESTDGPYYSDYLYDLNPGSAQLFARLVDSFGATYDSDSTTLTVLAESDGDGLSDAWEMIVFAALPDPLSQSADGDFDNDGYTNLEEYQLGNDPTVAENSDNDPIPDGWEIRLGLNPNLEDSDGDGTPDGDEDTDSDELTNATEFQIGTNPSYFDSDGDLLPDGWEVLHNLDPLDASGDNGQFGDGDLDDASNFEELIHGSDPEVSDTDGDGALDGAEIDQGSDPNNAGDGGAAPPPEAMVTVPFSVGDPSGSHSERWRMNIQGGGPDDTRQFGVVSPDFGEMGTQSLMMRKGNSYTISLSHLATNQEDDPDYDWQAQVDGKPETVVKAAGASNSGADRYFVLQDHWVVDNQSGLLGEVNQGFSSTNNTTGKTSTIIPIIFSVEEYSATVTPPDPDVNVINLPTGGATITIGEGVEDTFTIEATVKGSVAGAPNDNAVINSAISKWKLNTSQDVAAFLGSNVAYPDVQIVTTGSPVPGIDLPQDGFPEKTFSGNNDTQQIEYADAPKQTFISAWQTNAPDEFGVIQPPTPGVGPLQFLTNEVTFITRVYVEHEDTEERIYLKWVKWKIKWTITFDVEFENNETSVSFEKLSWDFDKLEEGDGVGPQAPTEANFLQEHTRVPQ